MTTLYRPVLIETAEQAEALPDDAIVINEDGDRYNRLLGVGTWHSLLADRDIDEDLCSTYWPHKITALVPIEAEEETRLHTRPAGTLATANGDPAGIVTATTEQTRLVTPWGNA